MAAAACVLRLFLAVLKGFSAVLLCRYLFKLRAAVRDSSEFNIIIRTFSLRVVLFCYDCPKKQQLCIN